MRRAIVINFLSWGTALRLANEAALIYGERVRVYKDPIYGWTTGEVRP